MRKLALLLTAILFVALLAACKGAADDEATIEPTDESQPGTPAMTLTIPVQATSTAEPSGYPSFPTPTPPGTDTSGAETGYPVATPLATQDPYPGGLATIIHPMGLQCEEPIFPDLSAAVFSLEEAGITVVAAEEIGLEVCEACGCATSMHFQVQIDVDDLNSALDLGWQR